MFTAGDAGMHIFVAAFNRFGTFYLAAIDTANPSINGAQTGIVVPQPSPAPSPRGGGSLPAAAGSGNTTTQGNSSPMLYMAGSAQPVDPADYMLSVMAGAQDDLSLMNASDAQWLDAVDSVMANVGGKHKGLLF
jgi:hypothetical protein